MNERCLVAEFNAECQHCHQEVRGAQCYHCKEFVIQCAICHVSVKGEDHCCHLVIVLILIIRCEGRLGLISRFQSSFSSLCCTIFSVNSLQFLLLGLIVHFSPTPSKPLHAAVPSQPPSLSPPFSESALPASFSPPSPYVSLQFFL